MPEKKRKPSDGPDQGSVRPEEQRAPREVHMERGPYGSDSLHAPPVPTFRRGDTSSRDRDRHDPGTGSPALLGASERIVGELPVGVYVANRWGEVMDANPAFLEMLGVSSVGELGGRPLAEFGVGVPDDFGWLLPEGDLTVRGGDGSQRTVIHTKILKGEDQTSGYSFGIIVDVDALRGHGRDGDVVESTRLHSSGVMGLDALTGSIVHDVNNLLVAIIGHARLVGTDAGLHGQSLAIEHAALRAAELTNQLVDYAEKSSLAFRELDVSELLTEMRALLAGSVSASTEINFILEARLPRVRGDASQLRQVAMNLVTNAADALADRPGSITVRTGRLEPDGGDEARVSSAVYLEVSDTGSGMDEATLVKIFDPFFTTKQAGRGLGMAIVVGIVRGHGGTIAVDSSVAGTTVRFSLPGLGPRGETDSGLHRPAAVATREAAAGTVLVVDDDEGVRVVTRMMMEQAGYRVLTARDGQEAVDIFQVHGDAITVVLLDLKIPKLDSREVFEIVHRVRPDIPVVLSSGYPEAEARRRFGTSEFAAYVPKPYTQRLLLKQIQQVLGT